MSHLAVRKRDRKGANGFLVGRGSSGMAKIYGAWRQTRRFLAVGLEAFPLRRGLGTGIHSQSGENQCRIKRGHATRFNSGTTR